MARTNQRGSILEFIIIGGVMALLLVGGAYFVRRTLVPSDSTSEPKVSRNGRSKDSSDSADSSKDAPSDKAPDTKKEDQPKQADSPKQDADDAPDDNSSQQASSGEPSPEKQSDTPNNLPQTGPADTVLSSFLVGGIVAAGAAYIRSRN